MAVRIYKPTSPGRRRSSVNTFTALTPSSRPEKRLLVPLARQAGRNVQGKITVRHRGGGHKRFYRLVDFQQRRYDQPAKVLGVQYDPNRSAHLALIEYPDRQRSYIIAPAELAVGQAVVSSARKVEIRPGNRTQLQFIPTGLPVHNIELTPGRGGAIVRSAGSAATILSIEGDFSLLKLPSGEVRKLLKQSMASIGQVANVDHSNVRFGKAGRRRWLGIRPSVRGKAMNPVDHPHGGGEGHNPIGMKHPKTYTGKPALGVKTRRRPKYSDHLIINRPP
ncbi:MAG: 50S ribosomal protein L2 [Candidatus Kerfeldbacteria bacterium]|nr:50S ribosomal protein L2 [Candidatus Kerfeldbacteria bacterium]